MPETAVETPICDICGAEVRQGSQFCYNCGGSLTKTEVKAAEPEKVPASSTPTNGAKEVAAERRSARRRRAANREPVEIVWEPETGVSAIYIAASAVLIIVAALLFGVAMWLK